MFEQAARMIGEVLVSAGYEGKTYGRMVFVSPRLAITAKHVTDIRPACIERWDGVWDFETVFEDPPGDIAVVRVTDLIRKPEPPVEAPARFPGLAERFLSCGSQIGILGLITRVDAETFETTTSKMFSAGFVGFQVKHLGGRKWALQGAFAERGFGGGPAFNPAGRLVGLVCEAHSIRTEGQSSVPWAFPVISDLYPCRDALRELIQRHG